MAKRTTRRAPQSHRTEPDVLQDASAASAPAAVMEHEAADEIREPGPDEIARRAYELFCERGCEPGREVDDWLQAERELRHHR